MQAEFDLSPQSTWFVPTSPYEFTSESGLSPQASSFVSMSSYEMTYEFGLSLYETTPESGLSPQATIFVPMSTYEPTYESGLSPHAATFVPTSTEQIILPNNYRPGMERIESCIESCKADLVSQYNDLKQHEEECARHYIAFLK
jgi:hypothetical protein